MQQNEKQELVKSGIERLLSQRGEFYALMDEKIAKNSQTGALEYKELSADELKKIYAKFCAYDYEIRKLLPYLYEAYEVKFNV